jgi:regulator of sigma E protease
MILLQKTLWFIVALGVLIIVHEYGHYLVARLCRVKVLRFSVGFGRPLFTRRIGPDRTEWVIAAVPLGGYVKMLDEREGPVEPHEAHRAFNRQNVWKRLAIVAAGPVFNFLFAILVYAGLFMHGLPEAKPVLAEPAAGSPAQAAGFRPGDTVRAVNGQPLSTWSDLRWRVLKGALQKEQLDIEVVDERQQPARRRLDLSGLSAADIEGDVLRRAGLQLQAPTLEPVLGEIIDGSPAQAASLRPGDRVVRVQDSPIGTWQEFVKAINQNPGRRLTLIVERDGSTVGIEVTPRVEKVGDETIGRIGAAAQESGKFYTRVSYGPLESLAKGTAKTWEVSVFTLKMLGKMVLGEVSLKHISGPITIADFAGQSAQMGWLSYLTFLALISISLGVLNLLPIPLLDGGHLMYYAVELIKGRPVSERAMELGQRVGLALLLVMMAFAFYNDFTRLLTG